MQTTTHSIFLFFCAFLFFFSGFIMMSCEKENNNNKLLSLSTELTGSSPCKSNIKSASDTPDSLSCINYSYNELSNTLYLKHINAGFNCCPDSMDCDAILAGDTIIVQEFESSAACNCDCLYDIDIEINGLDSRRYLIKLVEPYADNQAKILFEINVDENQNGSFCVTRKLYPWGVNSSGR